MPHTVRVMVRHGRRLEVLDSVELFDYFRALKSGCPFFPYFLHTPKPNLKISCEIAVIQDGHKYMFTVIKKGHGLCLGNPGLSERV